ncbi:hypothetical protein NPIL_680671 [Nephila pilipes]|uniref:Uncharacterized protein n=1 Tax=Nephila pilipes TaxID=299642 RepID=A0A8X6MQI0_NEPPI|nr:hypothetical protein NPIL_401711 [Nephila pilipes]GFT08381.1 hypothetical protein NPIL_84231 [Nephila pilipes]GFU02083.1 hypothetical protein NPIL_57971 [Nephila pilipes]GFU17567.1 hypothetical protein NPIL_680671 [Nephila pilipes]
MTHSRTFDDYKHEIMRLIWIPQHRHWTIDKLETRCWLMDVSGCGYNLVNHGFHLSNWWKLCNGIGRVQVSGFEILDKSTNDFDR